jgi:Bifunctional DNA primase/polymerase, N-terminal
MALSGGCRAITRSSNEPPVTVSPQPRCQPASILSSSIRALPWREFQDRRPARKELGYWIDRFPDRNGSIITGRLSRRIVLDCDSELALEWLLRHGVPRTQVLLTRRGQHYHFLHPVLRSPIRLKSFTALSIFAATAESPLPLAASTTLAIYIYISMATRSFTTGDRISQSTPVANQLVTELYNTTRAGRRCNYHNSGEAFHRPRESVDSQSH